MMAKVSKLIQSMQTKVLYFVSPNGDVDTNQILQQYVGIENERKEFSTATGGKVRVYQVDRGVLGQIRLNKNLKDGVTFYAQSTEPFLKEMYFPKPDKSHLVKKAA
jgi:hypothetical protein